MTGFLAAAWLEAFGRLPFAEGPKPIAKDRPCGITDCASRALPRSALCRHHGDMLDRKIARIGLEP